MTVRYAILLFLCAALASHGACAAETIRSADGIRSVSMMDAASPDVPFDITGWVVYPEMVACGGGGNIYIKDNSGSTTLGNFLSATNTPIRAGDYVRATGRVVLGHNGIYAQCLEMTRLAHRNPEPPIRATVEELLSGQHDGQLVTVRGEIRDSFPDDIDNRFLYFSLKDGDGSIYMATSTNKFAHTSRGSIIGDTVAATGVWISGRNIGTRRHIGQLLVLVGDEPLHIVKASETDIFNVPEITGMKSLMPSEVTSLERRRIIGTVLASWQGDQALVRTDDGSIVRIDITSPPVPEAGRRIEAVGFPETDLYDVNLNTVKWRPAQGNPIPPQPPLNLLKRRMQMGGDTPHRIQAAFHGRTVVVTGIVRGLPQSGGDRRMILEGEGILLPIDFSSCPDAISGLTIGCTVEVRGVWVMVADNWRPNSVFPKVKGAFVVVNAPDDLRVLARPPWWTPGRLLAVISALLVVLAWIFTWNRMLNRRSEKRGQELAEERVAHVTSDLKVYERTRLAVELHDSLSQNLTGVSLAIRAANRLADADPAGMRQHLGLAARTLDSCRDELRNCLWDLRNQTLEEADMNEAIRQTLAPHIGNARLSIRFNVPRERLSDNTAHALLRIIRELVSNAIRHGGATEIKVAGAIEDSRLLFSVADNGCGFDPERHPGAKDGHFGLQGIQDRVDAFEGDFTIASTPGNGTKATISIKATK